MEPVVSAEEVRARWAYSELRLGSQLWRDIPALKLSRYEMTVDRLAVCEPAPEPQELGLEHLQLCTARDDTSRCGTDYIRFCAETRDEMRVGDYEHRLCGARVSSPSTNSSSGL